MLYRILRPLLFTLDPERAHALALSTLRAVHRAGLLPSVAAPQSAQVKLMGLRFANRVGLAAGFDKNGRYVDALGALGFGFIEVGTVTPRPQPGQDRPRLFRLPRAEALINRMGFPNEGADAVSARLVRRKFAGICGANIGKNALTPVDRAVDDYVAAFRTLAPCVDYVAINVSSPNTRDLRSLQRVEPLQRILDALLHERDRLRRQGVHRVPILVKLSPDLDEPALEAAARLIRERQLDGVIATNTTVSRAGVGRLRFGNEAGGLSGAPLKPLAIRAIQTLRNALGGEIPIIGVGGVTSGEDARELMRAGADLIQVYTGLVYRGPGLVRELIEATSTPVDRVPAVGARRA
ncbi:MAG TPA: quinone-dependent dihydroorotate dehydrogenase [Steroidobacter sp.]